MSVSAIGWVWNRSRSEGAARLVLLAIADCANASGGEAWPSMAELCRKTRLSERGVQKAVRRLEEIGELAVIKNTGRGRTNRYRVIMQTPNPVRGYEDEDTPETPHDVRDSEDVNPELCSQNPERGSRNPEHSSPGTVKNQRGTVTTTRRSRSAPTPTSSARDDVERLCTHLADRIEAGGSKRPTIGKKWRDAARLLMDSDGRTEEQIHNAIDWCQDDEFWRANILAMPKLRNKYDTLRLQAARKSAAPRRSTTDDRVAAARAVAAEFAADGSQSPDLKIIRGEIA